MTRENAAKSRRLGRARLNAGVMIDLAFLGDSDSVRDDMKSAPENASTAEG